MEEFMHEMSDGVKVYVSVRQPTETPVGHIHILHGMAEHSGRYDEAAAFFVRKGYLVTAHDHRGHGKTSAENGIRGHFGDDVGFEVIVSDVFEVVSHLKTVYPTEKFILMGHSMGSFIARRFIQLHGEMVDQVVLSGTGDDGGIARFGGVALGHVLGKRNGYRERNPILDALVFGGFNRSVEKPMTKFDWLSKNNTHVFSYLSDEYCGFVPTTQFFLDLFQGLGIIHDPKEVSKIPKMLPILLFSGTEDPVGNHGKALWKVAKQYDAAGIDDVTVLLFDGGRHELLNDASRPEVIQAVLEWIEKR